MKIAVKRDQFVGSFLVAFGIVYGLMTLALDFPMAADYPGPKLLPSISVFGLVVCGIGVFIQSTRDKKPQPAFMVKEGWLDLGKSFTALIIYVVGLKYLGFLICTPILLFTLSTFFAKKVRVGLIGRIMFALLTTGAVYVFYIHGFDMKLPVGELLRQETA